MKKLMKAILGIIILLIVVLIFNTMMFTSKQETARPVKLIDVDANKVSMRLSQALQIPTTSYQETSKFDTTKFVEFRQLLEKNYPLVHQNIELKVINDYSLLYKWPGSDTSLKPVIFMAHIDVVPVEPGTESGWTYEPFSGAIKEGFIWGRGALDMKSTLVAILEAAEENLKQGLSPKRTMYLAFGHDEEIGGKNGAKKIVDYLKKHGVKIAFTIDEGMPILDKNLSPAKQLTAIIGLAEKGYITLKITAKGKGGHSSMPPLETTLGIIAKAITALEKNQMPASYSGPIKLLFDYIGPEMPFIQKMLFANHWLFERFIISRLEKITSMNALIRTTMAPTVIQGGVKENVLPSQAHVLVNFRIRPGNTPDDVVAHAKKVISNPAVDVSVHGRTGSMPSPVASVDAIGFKTIQKTISEVFENTIVAPGLLVAGTDTKHYMSISDNNYRFLPLIFDPEDSKRIHGINERIAVDNYVKMIQYNARLMENVSK